MRRKARCGTNIIRRAFSDVRAVTLVTSIFLPLSLVAGWYGMNLRMPEYSAKYAYPVLIGVCAAVCAVWFVVFRKKGWFK